MFDYWRSFLTIHNLVEKNSGNVQKVFEEYRKWDELGRK